ncbi:hypothetical protein KI387_025277, partial [Taxus chinensis]
YLKKNKEYGDSSSSEMQQINLGTEQVDADLPATKRRKDEPPPNEVDKDLPRVLDKKASEGRFEIGDW